MFKNLMKFAFLFLIGVSMVSITSCGKDDPIVEPEPEPVKIAPSIEILSTGFHDTLTTTEAGALFTLHVKADTGSTTLKSFAIYQEGVKMPVENFRVNGETPASNPISILTAGEDKGFTWDVAIRTQTTYDTQLFTVEITDDNGLTGMDTIVSVVNEPVTTTPIDIFMTDKVFYNNSGPLAGGINLLDGTEQSTVSGTPHIKDNGLNANGDWAQTISTVGGVILRSVPASAIDFASVGTKDEILDMFTNGTAVETGAMAVGTTYTAEVPDGAGASTYVIFTVTAVTVTPSDNKDYYTISIKH